MLEDARRRRGCEGLCRVVAASGNVHEVHRSIRHRPHFSAPGDTLEALARRPRPQVLRRLLGIDDVVREHKKNCVFFSVLQM